MAKPVFTIGLDRLVLLLNGAIVPLDKLQQSGNRFYECKLSNTVLLRKNSKQSNPNFYNCFDVIINNKMFGQLFYNDKGKYRYSIEAPALLHVSNHILYADGLAANLNQLLQILPDINFHSYQAIDIAVDGHDLVSKHQEYVTSKQYHRKANIKNISIMFDDRNKTPIGYIVGSKQSDKHIGIYNKQAEIIISGKHYITEFWGKNDLIPQVNKTIDRVEGRLTSKELSGFSKNFVDLEDPVYLASYFKQKFENYLVFNKKSNQKERRHLINWQILKTIKIQKEKTTVIALNSTFTKKITLHL